MPMTLVTGLPGSGKTLYTLARWKPLADKEGRPVFHNNIPGLNIPNWQVWDVERWQDLPPGSILIVDEAQFAFKVTGRGQTPEWVQKLAVHRHGGLDIVFITQHPMLLDVFVRKLCDRHFHVMRKFGLRWATIHEFASGVNESPNKSRKGSIRHDFRYPKEVFGWYKSSELHTVQARIPMRLWVMLALPVIALLLGYFAFSRVRPDALKEQADKSVVAAGGKAGSAREGGGGRMEPMTLEEYATAYRARVPGLAHTAPIYDDVTKPVVAPYPAACVSMKGRCGCYSQQATKLDVAADVCEQIVAGGYFVAWDKPIAQAVPIAAPAASEPPPVQYAQATGIGYARPAPTVPEPSVPPDLGAPARVRAQPRGTGS